MGKKKQTAGEKIAGDACGKCSKCRMCAFGRNELARCIDAAIKRAVKEAWTNGTEINRPSCSLKNASERKVRIEAKYNVKL